MIHVIGDSHVSFFIGKNEIVPEYPPYCGINNQFSVYRIGAPIAFNLLKENTTYKAREKILYILPLILPEDKVLFSFGEIDCRYHIGKNVRRGYSQAHNVYKCVERYVDGLLDLMYNFSNISFGVWGPIPSTKLPQSCSSRDCPITGDMLERNQITLTFNVFLEQKSKEFGFKFFTLFYDLVDSYMGTDLSYYMDNIHLNQKAMPLALGELAKKGWI
ncbi:MAG: hypothetical protein RBR32_01700 [Bacteroidales bacterium]|nr:hypothetical protein [Bacteroidales bacterium]